MSIDLPTFDRQSDTKTWHCDVFASLLRIYGCFHEKKFPCPVLILSARTGQTGPAILHTGLYSTAANGCGTMQNSSCFVR